MLPTRLFITLGAGRGNEEAADQLASALRSVVCKGVTEVVFTLLEDTGKEQGKAMVEKFMTTAGVTFPNVRSISLPHDWSLPHNATPLPSLRALSMNEPTGTNLPQYLNTITTLTITNPAALTTWLHNPAYIPSPSLTHFNTSGQLNSDAFGVLVKYAPELTHLSVDSFGQFIQGALRDTTWKLQRLSIKRGVVTSGVLCELHKAGVTDGQGKIRPTEIDVGGCTHVQIPSAELTVSSTYIHAPTLCTLWTHGMHIHGSLYASAWGIASVRCLVPHVTPHTPAAWSRVYALLHA